MNTNKNSVLIGGMTNFGSGAVIKKIMKNFFYDSEVINTSKMNLIGIFKSIKTFKDKDIYFHPSIAGFSWIRDLILSALIDFYGNKKFIIILCDLEYTKFNFFAKPLIKNLIIKNSSKIFLPADINFPKIKSFRKIKYELHHLISINNNLVTKEGNIFYLYANYLTKDKGINQFMNIFDNGFIIGSGDGLRNKKHHKIYHTNSKNEFDKALNRLSNKRLIFCYLSKFDLSPILLQEIIAMGIVIGVFKGSKSEKILNSQYYDVDYIYLDEAIKNNFSKEEYDRMSDNNFNNFLKYQNKIIHSKDSRKVYISI